jgi:hypothetical protein
VPCRDGCLRCVHQSQIYQLDPGTLQPSTYTLDVSFESLFQPGELRPVGFKSDAEEPNT